MQIVEDIPRKPPHLLKDCQNNDEDKSKYCNHYEDHQHDNNDSSIKIYSPRD